MIGYSSTTSIIFIAFGVLYGAGFLIAAWILVRKLLERHKTTNSNVVEGAPNPTGLIATPAVVAAAPPNQPSTKKDPSAKDTPEASIPIDLGVDSPVDGGGF